MGQAPGGKGLWNAHALSQQPLKARVMQGGVAAVLGGRKCVSARHGLLTTWHVE
jgi:hypothetical protein